MNKTKLITTGVVHFTSSTTVKKMAFLFWILSRSFLLLFPPVFTTVCTSFSLCLHSQKSSRIDSKCLGWSWCLNLLPSVWHAGLFADQCVCVRACEWMHCKPSVGVDYYVMAWCVTPNNSAIIFYISNNDFDVLVAVFLIVIHVNAECVYYPIWIMVHQSVFLLVHCSSWQGKLLRFIVIRITRINIITISRGRPKMNGTVTSVKRLWDARN